jgi:Zn finger protein HypA/HybF involved in hydrogenase expression
VLESITVLDSRLKYAAQDRTCMHELGAAQGVVDAVLFEAEKNNAKKIKEINVDVGELLQISSQSLANAINLLMKDPKLEGAQVYAHLKEASFSCRGCGARWNMGDVKKKLARDPAWLIDEDDSEEHHLPQIDTSLILCPRCGSIDVEISDGADEIRLRKLVME